MGFKHLKEKVLWTLERFELARNDDHYLTLKIWNDWYQIEKQFPITSMQQFYELIRSIPKAEDIVRCRRKINEEGKYLATDPIVIEARKKKTDDALKTFGYH